jgi:hypothetical protein
MDHNLRVLLVPQRDEVGLRSKNQDSKSVEQLLASMSVPFNWCGLAGKHYMPLDGHPNAEGYRVISHCVLEELLLP